MSDRRSIGDVRVENDIFPARITDVGTEVTDAAGSWFPHGWVEMELRGGTRGYRDAPIGRSGTSTLNPAFLPTSGDQLMVGQRVFLRARGYSDVVDGIVYEVVGCCLPAAGSGSGGSGSSGSGGVGPTLAVVTGVCPVTSGSG